MKRFSMTRFWIWTIENHDFIAAQVRTYFFAAAFLMLLLCFGGIVSAKEMAVGLFVGGFMGLGLLYIAIERRRTHLMKLRDPGLREEAIKAMLKLISRRGVKF